VINRSTDIGDLIVSGSGHKLFIVDQENPLRVYIHVPESFAEEVQVGTKADSSLASSTLTNLATPSRFLARAAGVV
jgi:hypothetical protein